MWRRQMGLMDQVYKAVPEGGDTVQAVRAYGLSSPGCHGRELKGPSPLLVHAQAVTATVQMAGGSAGPGRRGWRHAARRSAPRLASAVAEREACAAYARVRAGSGAQRTPRTGRAALRPLRRFGRRGCRLRRALRGALFLRLRVRFGVPLFEVRERIARLLRGEYPRRTLRGGRTRVRLAKVRTNDLAANPKRSGKLLGPERLSRSQCNHLPPGTHVRRTRLARASRIAVLGLALDGSGAQRACAYAKVESIGGVRCGVHGYRVPYAAYAAYDPKVQSYARPKARRTHVRAYARSPRRCLCERVFDPPCRPPACARRDFVARARGAKRAQPAAPLTFTNPPIRGYTA